MASTSPDPVASSEDSPSRENQTHRRVPRAGRVVCTACRQSKVRCIGPSQEACSRCARLGLDCLRDTSFKRVCKSRKIAELEKQVERLTSAFNGNSTQTPDVPTTITGRVPMSLNMASPQYSTGLEILQNGNSAPSFQVPLMSPVIHVPATNPPPYAPTPAVNYPYRTGIFAAFNESIKAIPSWAGERPPAKVVRKLQSVTLGTSEIDELFHIYFDKYHPFLPFLDPEKSPDECYNAAPVLFWAIISVASRRYTDDIMLFSVFTEWVPKLIWTEIATPPYSIASAQAVILVTTWPFPSPSMRNETLTTLSAIAISMCMQLGLHRPLNGADFVKTKITIDDTECRARTAMWAAASVASQQVEALTGILPITPFDTTIDLACQPNTIYTVPSPLRIKLLIQRYCHRVTKAVCAYSSSAPDVPTIEGNDTFVLPWQEDLDRLGMELHKIESENMHMFTVHDRVLLASARFYTSSFSFFSPPSPSPFRKHSILHTYNAAATLILIMMEADTHCSLFSHGTFYHIRIYLTAIFALVKVLRSSYAKDVDGEAGRKLCNRAMGRIGNCSVANNDGPAKAGKILAQVWHTSDTLSLERPPYLYVKSRLAGSLLYDFIWIWRREFGSEAALTRKVHNLDDSSLPQNTTTTTPHNQNQKQDQDQDISSVRAPLNQAQGYKPGQGQVSQGGQDQLHAEEGGGGGGGEGVGQGFFSDASTVDFEFLNDPNWMDVYIG